MSGLLDGLNVLVLEDEFLIAMDVEQICRDEGASDVVIARNIEDAEAAVSKASFDAAVIDIVVGSSPTFGFAQKLRERGTPFIFASGYTDLGENAAAFSEITVVGKPYESMELVKALAAAHRRG